MALATGLFFARFSRPTARLRFSRFALIAPYRGGRAFEFRIVNERANQLFHMEARVVLNKLERDGQMMKRKFYELALERHKIMFFPLNWTIVHPITKESPLFNVTEKELTESDAEFLVMLAGVDDTFSQTVHCWSSYKYDEIIWGAKFTNILEELDDGRVKIDLHRVHEFDLAQLPK
jgi:inward rectifier potassium channel